MDEFYEYLSTVNHHLLARELHVPHGDAVLAARSFCLSGNKAGPHGSTCPCDACTTRAILMIFEERWTPMNETRVLLQEVADLFPIYINGDVNVCRFCDKAWGHEDNCVWVKIRRYLGLPIGDEDLR